MFYIVTQIKNSYVVMRATTLEEAYKEAKSYAEAYELYDLEFVDTDAKARCRQFNKGIVEYNTYDIVQ